MAAGHEDTFHHVRDYSYFELPRGATLNLPEIPFLPSPTKIVHYLQGEIPVGEIWGLQLTRFMLLQVVAGVLALWIFRGLAKRIQSGEPASGRWWNFWEMLALVIRDDVVRPTIGDAHHDDHGHGHGDGHGHGEIPKYAADPAAQGGMEARVHAAQGQVLAGETHVAADAAVGAHPADRYLPFVWTSFFYVLFCNLLGAIPLLGSATGSLSVTAALAFVVFLAVFIYGAQQTGYVGFWTALAPPLDIPAVMKIVLVPLIWLIEFVGLFIRHGVLAVRLFANIMAGHTVLAAILTFIAVAAHTNLYFLVLPSSIFGQVFVGLLELLFAFIQAYIFAFLSTLFISMAVHPH
jgi:F-type H+-transporting ATPase subunit a